VEMEPGKKDPRLIREFIQAARSAELPDAGREPVVSAPSEPNRT